MHLLNKNKLQEDIKNKISSKKIIAIVIGATLLIGGGGYIYTTNLKKKEVSSEMVSRERYYTVEKGDIVAGIDSTGKIKFNQVTQNFKKAVTMDKLFVKVGQRINKGDKIAENLYANTGGIVIGLGNEQGEGTEEGISSIIIAQDGDVFAEIPVSQEDILNIEEGQQVYIWVSAYEDEKFSGKVDFINLKPNSESGSTTYTVTVKLDENSNELLPGMSISSQFIFKELNNVLTLSNKAITLKDGKQMVKVRQKDGTLKEKVITTGFSDGKKSEITSGLNEGDTVVVGGQ